MRGVGSVLGAAAAFGAVSVLARRAYEAGSDPVSLLGARLVVAAICLSALALPAWRPPDRHDLILSAPAGVAFAGAGLGEFAALSRAPAATVVLLVFVAPVWVCLAAWIFRGERLGWARAGALAALLAGLGLVVATPHADAPDARAVALALGASAMSAAFFLSLEGLSRRVPPRLAACVATWIAAVAVIPLDPYGVAGELLRPETRTYAVAIGALTGVALALLASGIRLGSALTASAVICAEPVIAAALSWVVLDELLTRVQIAGAALVMVSVTAVSALTGRAPPERAATGRTRRRRPGSRPPPRPARSARRPR